MIFDYANAYIYTNGCFGACVYVLITMCILTLCFIEKEICMA